MTASMAALAFIAGGLMGCGSDGGNTLPDDVHQGMSVVEGMGAVTHESISMQRASQGTKGTTVLQGGSVSMIEPLEDVMQWRILVMNTTDKTIEAMYVRANYGGTSTTINVVPDGQSIPPKGDLEVSAQMPPPSGGKLEGVYMRYEVIGARFSDATTVGEIP
ncbi:MAG: hypothetical protein ACIAS6_10685 [Phycisphaerales bacterium JB060]